MRACDYLRLYKFFASSQATRSKPLSTIFRHTLNMEEVSVTSRIGTLHTEEVIKRYRDAGADLLVLMFLTSGVPLFLKDLRVRRFPRGRRPNNNTAKSQPGFVATTLLDWESQGFIERVPLSEVKCLLPLTVAERWSHSKDKLKYRLGAFSSYLLFLYLFLKLIFYYFHSYSFTFFLIIVRC